MRNSPSDAHYLKELNQYQERIDNLKTYRVTASYVSYCIAEIEAESMEEAEQIARNLDGSDFIPAPSDDWEIDSIEEMDE